MRVAGYVLPKDTRPIDRTILSVWLIALGVCLLWLDFLLYVIVLVWRAVN